MKTVIEHKKSISALETEEEIKNYLLWQIPARTGTNSEGYSPDAIREITGFANKIIKSVKPVKKKPKKKRDNSQTDLY
jgi:hypothetical protein